MKALGLTWDNVFDPCTNIAAAGAVLSGNYHSVRAGLHPQRALRIALSMYNTGSQSRGFSNGYVGRVRSEEHTSELQSLMRISYAVFCLKKNRIPLTNNK